MMLAQMGNQLLAQTDLRLCINIYRLVADSIAGIFGNIARCLPAICWGDRYKPQKFRALLHSAGEASSLRLRREAVQRFDTPAGQSEIDR